MSVPRRVVLLVTVALLPLSCRGWAAQVVVIKTPDMGEVPAVEVDARGVLHLAYGREGNAYYAESHDWGKTFSKPVRIDQRAGTVTVGGERGPKLALGKNGVVHVVWLGHYQKGGGVWYTRSVDGGRSFEPARSLQGVTAGSDGATVAADGKGNAVVCWLDGRLPEDPNSPTALPIYMAHSRDDGESFSSAQPVKHDHPRRACSCCALNAHFGPDGYLYLSFRSGFHNIRDIHLLRGRERENSFRAVRVHDDNWFFEGCPMSGAPFTVLSGGRVLIAWRNRGKVYWSLSRSGAAGFRQPAAAPGGEGQNHPRAIANPQGEVLFAWEAGQKVEWAVYTPAGRPTGQHGVAGAVRGLDRFAAFARPDGRFCIVL